MTVVRLARLVVLLVIACSCVVIASERRAQTEVRERQDCFKAGVGFNELLHADGGLGPAVAEACGQRDPTPGVRLRRYEEDVFFEPEPEPEAEPKYIGAIASVSASSVTLTERCDHVGTPLERTTVFRFADEPVITIPSPDDRSGTQQSSVAGLATAARSHELWELTLDDGQVVAVFPWFLDVCG